MWLSKDVNSEKKKSVILLLFLQVWQVVSCINRRIYRVYLKYLDKYHDWDPRRKKEKYTYSKFVFGVQPPRSPDLNPSDFLSVGTLKCCNCRFVSDN